MKISLICIGDIAPNCPGKIGDVILVSGIAKALHNAGADVCFYTNPIMFPYIQKSYGYVTKPFTSIKDICGRQGHILFFKNELDPDLPQFIKELLESKISDGFFHITGLDAFDNKRPHMAEQIIQKINDYLQLGTLNLELKDCIPELYAEVKPVPNSADLLLLPFSGSGKKWLGIHQIKALQLKLGDKLHIGCSPYGEEIKFMESEIQNACTIKNENIWVHTFEQFAAIAYRFQKIITVDSGMNWGIIACLNYLVSKGDLKDSQIPEIFVVQGRDNEGKLLPAANVWKPMSYFPKKIHQINPQQESKLQEIVLEEIID